MLGYVHYFLNSKFRWPNLLVIGTQLYSEKGKGAMEFENLSKLSRSINRFALRDKQSAGWCLSVHQTPQDVFSPRGCDCEPATDSFSTDAFLHTSILYFQRLTQSDQQMSTMVELGPECSIDQSDIFDGADLSGVDLHSADLRGAELSGADLSDAILPKALCVDADFSEADLSRATLSRASFRDADLSGADLSGASLDKANFRDADFSGATLSDGSLTSAKFQNATLTNAELSGASCPAADFENADLTGTNVSDAIWLHEK